ncbi:hypothetical protein QBC41DRAFT_378053 [Cercophora samala]|uniref:BZIP transcription factor n=1 Tax=Cercophora samala TaxID=330535 RepID=A0AA39ZNJ3_9PEZI|nr:hypothetical protein QBC41DRAFT_378053 [Cercophora samala]
MAGNHVDLNVIAFTPAAPAPAASAFNSHSRGGGPRALALGSGVVGGGGFGSSTSNSNSGESPTASASTLTTTTTTTTTTTPMSGVNTDGNTNANLPDTADDGGTSGSSNSKKRKAAPGSRGVANLTPEQLAKKRANDREAQRAIRERQRLKIEQYEREIRELKSQQPYLELQAAIRQREAVEAELAEVKSCLARIMQLVQPMLAKGSIVGQQHPVPLPSPAPTHHPALHHQHHGLAAPTPTSVGFSGSGPGSVASPRSVGTHGRWHSSMSPVVTPMGTEGQHQQHQHQPHQFQQSQASSQAGILAQQRHDLGHGLDLGSDRLGLEFLLDPAQKIARIHQNAASSTQYHQQVPVLIPPTPTAYPPHHTQQQQQSQQQQQQPFTNPHPPTTQPHQAQNEKEGDEEEEDFTTLPLNCPPTCPLDSILLDFLSERRHLLSLPTSSPSSVLGPPNPSISSLLNPSLPSHPLSKVFTDILARFPGLCHLPERVAVLHLMFLLMRWQISPTRQNWERIPPYFRPGAVQRGKRHPAWVDYIPWGKMRDRIIEGWDDTLNKGIEFENFFIPFTGTLRVGWMMTTTTTTMTTNEGVGVVLVGRRGGGKEGGGEEEEEEEEEIRIDPGFERHLRALESWSLGEEFERAFPELGGTYKLRRG